MNKVKITASLFFIVFTFFVLSPTPVHASFFDDIVNGVKNIFTPKSEKELTINSTIALATGGDTNKNGQVDAGDTVKFSYIITNPTKNVYKSSTLKTNINNKQLNSIDNVQGILSIDTNHDTISIPHLTIQPNQVRKISFSARINYYKDADKLISTEAELVDGKNSSVFKAEKQEVNAKKLNIESFNKFVHITK